MNEVTVELLEDIGDWTYYVSLDGEVIAAVYFDFEFHTHILN